MRFGLFGTVVLAGMLLVTADAAAQLSPQWLSCAGIPDVGWNQQIESCTTLIQSGGETTKNRALAYNNRGNAYVFKGDYDRAVADFDEAIQIDPKYAMPHNDRGSAYLAKGDSDSAIADFDEAIRLDPKYDIAYRGRGLSYLYSGNLAKALADVSQASAVDPKDAYNALWVDIVGQRNNVQSRLSQATAKIDMTAWPAPVIRMFLGQVTPAAVLAAADDPDATKKKGHVCEANFYSGEWALRQGAKDEATRLFRLGADDCGFLEWYAANQELKALGGAP